MESWADQLIKEYTVGRKDLLRRVDRLDKDHPEYPNELRVLNSMISDMEFAIKWLKEGRQPDTFRGIDKKSIYQKRHLESMDIIPDITSQLNINDRQLYLSDYQKNMLIDILSSLSARERECYLLHTTQDKSMEEIAEVIGVRKRTVQQYIERAREKIEEKAGRSA